MARFKFLIVDLENVAVVGTDNEAVKNYWVQNDAVLVIDSDRGLVLSPEKAGDMDIKEETQSTDDKEVEDEGDGNV